MTLEQIITFMAVYHAGSYQKAAERLFLPQPTVSNRIKQLERELNKPLFIRSKNGSRLTEEGHAYLPYAKKILESIEAGKQAVEKLERGLTGKLSIGCNNSFASSLLPPIIESFITKYPDVSIRVHSYSPQDQFKKIKDKEFQLGISRYAINDPQLTFHKVHAEPVELITSSHHRLASRSSIKLPQLLEEHLILYQSDTLYRKTLDVTLSQLNVKYEIKYETNNLQLIKSLIQNNLGVFLCGPSFFLKELKEHSIVSIPIENNPFPVSQVFLMYQKESLNSLDYLFIKHFENLMTGIRTRHESIEML